METGNIKQALSEIKQMMNMPMKCFTPSASQRPSSGSAGDENVDPQAVGDKENEGKENNGPPMSSPADGDSIQEGDLPGQICRVLGKSKFTCNVADDIRYSYRRLGLVSVTANTCQATGNFGISVIPIIPID